MSSVFNIKKKILLKHKQKLWGKNGEKKIQRELESKHVIGFGWNIDFNAGIKLIVISFEL